MLFLFSVISNYIFSTVVIMDSNFMVNGLGETDPIPQQHLPLKVLLCKRLFDGGQRADPMELNTVVQTSTCVWTSQALNKSLSSAGSSRAFHLLWLPTEARGGSVCFSLAGTSSRLFSYQDSICLFEHELLPLFVLACNWMAFTSPDTHSKDHCAFVASGKGLKSIFMYLCEYLWVMLCLHLQSPSQQISLSI